MGSSIRSYLWLCCGVFYQIPTLARALTSPGEGYEGSEGSLLCLHLSCLFLLSALLPVYLLFVVADLHGNVCLFAVCVHAVHLGPGFAPSSARSVLCSYKVHAPHCTCTCASVTLCVRVTVGDLVAAAARGGLLTLSCGRGASFSLPYRKQTS